MKEKKLSTTRLRLKKDELELIETYRNRHKALSQECDEKGIPIEDVKYYWHKSKRISMLVNQKDNDLEKIREGLIKIIETKAPKLKNKEVSSISHGRLMVINPADVHIGKLCSIYETKSPHNNKLIIEMVHDGIDGLLREANGFNVSEVLLVIGNDILHTDNARGTTTSGTIQDTDGMWYDNWLLAFNLYKDVITYLMSKFKVSVQYDPSNHDYTNGFFLAQALAAYFSKSDIDFNVDISHRKYFTYGCNLIGTTHGDGAKETDLALLMAQEASQYWHEAKHRYFYISHIHHKKAKDYGSVCVEAFRSPSGTDSWHHRNGYQHAPRAIEGFIHDFHNGQIARLTHIFSV